MVDKKKILFVSYTADRTGPTNSLFLLLKFLQNRYQVLVVLPQEGLFSEALKREAIPYIRFQNLSKKSIFALYQLIKEEEIDLVYGNSTHGSSRNALLAAKLAQVPFVCHVREMGWGKSWRRMGWLRWADQVVAVSKACANSIEKFVQVDRINVVYNGIIFSSTAAPEDRKNKLREQLELPNNSTVILSLGHLCERKGQIFAVEAMGQVAKYSSNVYLLLAGSLKRDPNYVRKIKIFLIEHQLEAQILLLGFREDAYELLQGSDIFLHTALKDPHPRVVVEAMGAKLPVISFDVDGVSETVESGSTGYLVPAQNIKELAEVVIDMLEHSEKQKEMGEAGWQRAQALYQAENTATQIGDMIDLVFADRL